MNHHLKYILFLVLTAPIVLMSCTAEKASPKLPEKIEIVPKIQTLNPEEEELKALVEDLLFAAGNYNLEALSDMISDKANLGISVLRDGEAKNSVITIGEYFERTRGKELKPYYETVDEYKILINQGQIAFVWADATMHSSGVPRTNNIDNFTFIKEDGEWKIINLSFTNTRLPDEKRKFDLAIFAKSYAQAWCSQRPNFVSVFFAEDGELTVNDGTTAKGTEAINVVAKGFMDTFPDMMVTMDSLDTNLDKPRFYWTLTGTNNVDGGTGNKVKISGFEEWTLSDDGLIQASNGQFDNEEYQRQLKLGIDN